MFYSRLLGIMLAISVFTSSQLSYSYDLDANGYPIPKETAWDFNHDEGYYGSDDFTNWAYYGHVSGSDLQSELASGLAAVIVKWNSIGCNSRYQSCLSGPISSEITGPDLFLTVPAVNKYWWTAKFLLTETINGVETTKTEDKRGHVNAYMGCPDPWRSTVSDRPVCALFSGSGFCPAGYQYHGSAIGDKCIAQCASGYIWNPTLKQCEQELKEESCQTKSKHPIDFFSGRKYRSEKIVTVGLRNPFSLIYYYDSKLANISTSAGTIKNYVDLNAPIDATAPQGAVGSYPEQYNKQGFLFSDATVLQGQYYGYIHDYWRHNFDEVLQIRGGTYILHTPDGKQLSFEGFGMHKSYNKMQLSPLLFGEEEFSGYAIYDSLSDTKKVFDESGRLRKIVQGKINDVITLTYDQDRLKSVRNMEGATIEFSGYSILVEDSIYAYSGSTKAYPTTISTSDGRQVSVEWGYASRSQVRTSYLITRISRPFVSAQQASREFSYNQYRPLLIDIHEVDDAGGQRSLYAHFEYDDESRAIASELAGGYERVEVNYVSSDERIVTNAKGLATTYTLSSSEGVKRLQSVSGAETVNCAPTNTVYTYYPNGTIETKTTNGITTHFTYNSRSLVETKREAFGTPEEIVTKTCWHSTLNKPERIIEANRVTTFQYDADGRLKSRAIEPRELNNETCQ